MAELETTDSDGTGDEVKFLGEKKKEGIRKGGKPKAACGKGPNYVPLSVSFAKLPRIPLQ